MVAQIAWLIFIRAESKRFHQKCYVNIRGKNIYGWLQHNAESANVRANDIFLCTSRRPSNLEIIDQAERFGHTVLLGSELHPINRIVENINLLKRYKYIVRICGDSPFYPYEFAMRAVKYYDYFSPEAITNLRKRIFPPGLSVEIYHRQTLARLLRRYPQIQYEEHMSSFLQAGYFTDSHIVDISTSSDLSFFRHSRYTVDYPDDIETIASCIDSGYDKILFQLLRELELT
jgi:spore coat polysaccharide biosynthesis protein SpsF (cytidylyltransferase family)